MSVTHHTPDECARCQIKRAPEPVEYHAHNYGPRKCLDCGISEPVTVVYVDPKYADPIRDAGRRAYGLLPPKPQP